ncbi:MAG TPA: UvrD-helicase domain-containing protein [Gallionella sp.]|nr:UvrD-helicase domain-containing protein [Gallionella sp.]
MSSPSIKLGGPDTDRAADETISACLNPLCPRNFFLFAGAGSGKTRSLKSALEQFRDFHGVAFRRAGKKIAVITYTNAAAEEISARVGADTLFPISTIHSFCWSQINNFHTDIQAWLLASLPVELEEIRIKHAKGRGGKAAMDRERAMEVITKRLEWLSVPRRFVYNPNGNNFGADSLSHAEVIKITAAFINDKPAMQAALINQYPFLLIDESQDTNKHLLDALFNLAAKNTGNFGLGLFGDTMQRIYTDGLPNLGCNIPPDWALPSKQMNHRSAQRVVELANALRADADGREQLAREDSKVGTVRLFIGIDTVPNKPALEAEVRRRMAEHCRDTDWTQEKKVKTLTLEHHMAASRQGFLPMFQALDKSSSLSTGLRSGELAGLRLFTQCVMPLVNAYTVGDKFAMLSVLRMVKSPLLSTSALIQPANPDDPLETARDAVDNLIRLLESDPTITFLAVLQCIADSNLFDIPASLRPFLIQETSDEAVANDNQTTEAIEEDTEEEDISPSNLEAWRTFLETPYCQINPYAEYVADQGPYGTHQGVKGLEFDRVLVIIDDSEAKGFSFSYGKLFGTQPLTDNDRQRASEGEDTANDRTRRLLYVTCTRAQNSLALVVYTNQPDVLAQSIIEKGWFGANEVEMVGWPQ